MVHIYENNYQVCDTALCIICYFDERLQNCNLHGLRVVVDYSTVKWSEFRCTIYTNVDREIFIFLFS